MTERQQQTVSEAIEVWEIDLLKFLYDKAIITQDEYLGIQEIAEKHYESKKICPNC